ncbi:hypothetical protein BJY00DRAFT_315837 [Aspergillus carlsbadensis]|nr:hypothetical protein BJY00DRAFT_315837 [Aspergillus carlsbadensis]
MDICDLRLSVPDVHLLPEYSDQGEAPPISGSVAVAVPISTAGGIPGGIPHITVTLVQHVSFNKVDSTTTKQTETGRHAMRFWKQTRTSPCRQASLDAHPISRVQRQTIARYDIRHAPDEIDRQAAEGRTWLRFNFHIPVPSSLAASIGTTGGCVSYTVEAATPTPPSLAHEGQQLHAAQPVRVVHLALPKTVSHLRRYPGHSVTTQLDITPLSMLDGVSYSLRWLARSTISPGARPSEVKYVVAKELHWSIDETVKYLAIANESATCLDMYTRRLSEGCLKGRWVANGGSEHGDDYIQIALGIGIPPGVNVSDTTALAPCQGNHSSPVLETAQESLAITVDHRLNLEVVTGEDTFHREQATS